ncbi:MAG: penicillin-binding protein 1C [Marinilabiliales bacterium]
MLITGFWRLLPGKLFNDPVCTVLTDKNDILLSAHIAADGQWRFPYNPHVPEKYKTALVYFEDKRFYYHNGVDPIAIIRALISNIKAGKTVSGGSTITMQVIRLSRKGKDRSIMEKITEIILATRLEAGYSKEEILSLYASNAPFGGNIVGLDAASWRYFGRKPDQLTWAEACMLAVLPNSPSLIHLGKNRQLLIEKRNKLLNKLLENDIIDKNTYELAIDEPIPDKLKPFPQIAPHLLFRAEKEYKKLFNDAIIKTTINIETQNMVEEIINNYNKKYKENDINNIAAIILDVETGNVLAYAGNASFSFDNGNQVDIIMSERSTGSILKPFLYASMLTSGEILPKTLIPDIPTNIGGYTPKNYNRGYDGAVPANRALARSLNIPAVKMLQSYGIERFIHVLKKLGFTTINQSADYYGLSLILGGCEAKLWEIAGAYASMARTLNHYFELSGKYSLKDIHMPNYIYRVNTDTIFQKELLSNSSILSASAIWYTFEAMLTVDRPQEEGRWEYFNSSCKIAWKTGTSFGLRDGWAIGLTPQYVVGVWVGNADGEGRPHLTGINTAGPVLFQIFNHLDNNNKWFDKPYDDMEEVAVCNKSGYLAGPYCDDVDTMDIPATGIHSKTCPYHQLVHLDKSEKYRVNADCEPISNIATKSWFVLPPAIEYYFKSKNSFYKTLPPFRDDCLEKLNDKPINTMELIYPKNPSKIYIPVKLTGEESSTVFQVAHRNPGRIIYWYLDDNYIGQTKNIHKMALSPDFGKHILTLIDQNGETLSQTFEIISKSK